MKLYYIFDEVHYFYLREKEARSKLVTINVDDTDLTGIFVQNRNIMRNIIDACNVWIENCVLYQHDTDTMSKAKDREFKMDFDLLIDLYLYGFASQSVSLLTLSKNLGSQELYYGLAVNTYDNTPAEVLKYHPIIFFNTAITGNQNVLVETPLTIEANNTEFGMGFSKEHGVEFLLFLAAIKGFQDDLLRGDKKSLTVISKEYFIDLVENYTKPKIDGRAFYDSFVMTKDKVKNQLRKKENIIWMIGTNKYRHELRPFLGLEDGNILISYYPLKPRGVRSVDYKKREVNGMVIKVPRKEVDTYTGAELNKPGIYFLFCKSEEIAAIQEFSDNVNMLTGCNFRTYNKY